MRLILVRHGQTPCNLTNIWHGQDDCDLTELGVSQAQAAAHRLANEAVTAVYSSDSRRAAHTAELIAQPHHLSPILTSKLRERDAGEFEGLPVDDILALHPDVWSRRAEDYWHWRPPGGETFVQVLARGREEVDRMRARHPDETVALVSHMSTVRVLMSDLLDLPIERTYDQSFPATGISILELDGAEARPIFINDARHLDEAGGGEFS